MAERRTARPPPIAASAVVAAEPTLWPTIIAQPCWKVSEPASRATNVVAAAALELCMMKVMTMPTPARIQRAAGPVPAKASRSHDVPAIPFCR